MSKIVFVALITLIAGVGGTGLGGAVGAFIKRDSKKIVSLLLSFAGGIMLAVVCFDLLESALRPDGMTEINMATLFTVIAVTLIGFAVIYFINAIIDRRTNKEVQHFDDSHPKTADDLDELIHSDHLAEHREKMSGLFIAGLVMAFAIALHNFPEGMVIGASYAGSTATLSGGAFLISIVIGLHNIPEGMAISVPLISGGMGRIKSVIITAASGFPTVLGALLGYFVGNLSPIWLAVSLSFASGAMLYVVFGELLPEAILMWKSKMPAFAVIVGIVLGLLIINV